MGAKVSKTSVENSSTEAEMLMADGREMPQSGPDTSALQSKLAELENEKVEFIKNIKKKENALTVAVVMVSYLKNECDSMTQANTQLVTEVEEFRRGRKRTHSGIIKTPEEELPCTIPPETGREQDLRLKRISKPKTGRDTCAYILASLLTLSKIWARPDIWNKVLTLVQRLVDGQLLTHEFVNKCKEVMPLPDLPRMGRFIQIHLPLVRQGMITGEIKFEGIRPPPPEQFGVSADNENY